MRLKRQQRYSSTHRFQVSQRGRAYSRDDVYFMIAFFKLKEDSYIGTFRSWLYRPTQSLSVIQIIRFLFLKIGTSI